MATALIRLRGKNLYLQLSAGRGKIYERKAGISIRQDEWNNEKNKFINRNDDEIKRKKKQLENLIRFVENEFDESYTNGINFDGEWLQTTINKFHNQDKKESDTFLFFIQKSIENAPYKRIPTKGGKFKVGLSNGRIKGIIQFKNIFETFQNDTYKGNPVEVTKINKQTLKDFNHWLDKKNYSTNYKGKQLANFKSILNDILDNENLELQIKPSQIKVVHESKEPEAIIYLSFAEIEIIQELNLPNNYLENARKWLVLGCNVGQRVSDLLRLNPKMIKEIDGRKFFEIQQMKTKKNVTIPVFPEVQQIIDEGFPYPISEIKLREYIKEICRIAGFDNLMTGRIRESRNGKTIKGKYPKWKLISTHTMRRSFASNYYGKMPTPLIMNITGHSLEKDFLTYIGRTSSDLAQMMFDYVEKMPKNQPKAKLRVLRNGTENN